MEQDLRGGVRHLRRRALWRPGRRLCLGRGADDVETLKGISSVAAAAHAPFISSAASDLFDIDSFTDIGKPRDLAKIFERPEYAAWNSFPDSEDSRYVGLTLPRTLARLPYGADSKKVKSFNFNEGVDGTDHDQYVWSNAAYAFAGRLTEAFDKHGWRVAVRGVEVVALSKSCLLTPSRAKMGRPA